LRFVNLPRGAIVSSSTCASSVWPRDAIECRCNGMTMQRNHHEPALALSYVEMYSHSCAFLYIIFFFSFSNIY
jgi:hypothetical protein